ncbi:hypothetical protein M2352_005226 [Azospirillum fermentarium]|uniref:hypothetical protein n=1 Tax=Azospirillum fermentarium TaxID=1233114 RepID=UPI002226DEA1|nr:hypothetical protein [Azospirillum fermentarium]MCW2249543.1 hypothetical protein [Azospirillum fermentarium]
MAAETFNLSHEIAQKVIGRIAQANQQLRALENAASDEVAALRTQKALIVSRKGRAIAEKPSLNIVGLFYDHISEAISNHFRMHGHNVKIIEKAEDLEKETELYDIFFTTSNYVLTQNNLSSAVNYTINCGKNGISCIWLWDHHHMFGTSLSISSYFDIVFPIHETSVDYLKTINTHVMNSLPAATYQFGSIHEMEEMYIKFGARQRSDSLYGGFREYPDMSRNFILRECIEKITENNLYLRPQNIINDKYYNLPTTEDRFAEWVNHKVSLSVSINTDIPIRIFDALSAGQIPLVCSNINGLDHIISVEDQLRLPVIRFNYYDINEIRRAYEIALKQFDQGGREGAYKRHLYAMRNHTMVNRIARMIETLRLHFR